MTTPHDQTQNAAGSSRSLTFGPDCRAILICLAVFMLAATATMPLMEMGIADDWSYNHMAREFAISGHINYNGWVGAMLVPQIWWASLFIKLFGFSFFILRLSTLLLVVFLIPVLYFLGRESGLAPPFAIFATLLTTLSPLFLPVAASFMSDIPGFFLFIVCFFSSVKAWKARSTRACLTWAGVVMLAGILSGLDRQIYWLAPVLFIPVVVWMQRRRKAVVIGLSSAWIVALLVVAYSIHWFQAKPYTLVEPNLSGWTHTSPGEIATFEIGFLKDVALTLVLLLLPLLAGYKLKGFRARPRSLMLAGLWAVGFAIAIRHHHVLPRMGNVITEYGIFPYLAPGGEPPVILGPIVRDVLTFAVLFSCTACGLALWRDRRERSRIWCDPVAPTLALGLVFAAPWLLMLMYRSPFSPPFDRYVLTFLTLFGIPLLRHYQVHIAPRVNGLSWVVLALFACYGVATTHDQFAAGRARLTAAGRLETSGVPRTAILVGFEHDGWTQLDAGGYANESRIQNPVGAYRPLKCHGPAPVRMWYLPWMPAVQARYFISLTRFPDLESGPVAPVAYTTWLPPARREVFTQVLPGGGDVGCR